MTEFNDTSFDERVAANVNLFNEQRNSVPPHNVAASAAFAAARYTVWATAAQMASGSDLAARRQEALDTFANGYRQMLEEHLDDFIANYNTYFQPQPGVITR